MSGLDLLLSSPLGIFALVLAFFGFIILWALAIVAAWWLIAWWRIVAHWDRHRTAAYRNRRKGR